MGAHHQNEEFGDDYELPPDRAYAETCASIASVMVAWRLLLRTGDSTYADQIERTLLNGVLVAPRADGRAFYYSNTLHRRERTAEVADDELSERAEASMRAPWFEVSCCPTNVARTLASVAGYFATADDDGIQLHQYGELRIDTRLPAGRIRVRVSGDYPLGGRIRVTVEEAPQTAVRIALRVPAWARGRATLAVAGRPALVVDGTSAFAERTFQQGEVLELVLPMEPRIVHPHPRIDAVRGQIAIERGPLVLALEDVDLPDGIDVERVEVDTALPPVDTGRGAAVTLRLRPDEGELPPYGASAPAAVDQARSINAELRPYKDWANRGPSTMRVWMPALVAPAHADGSP